jgi:hypothetical protein
MKPQILFHCTTPKKAKLYKDTGHICSPVRGFSNLQAALAWCVKTGRSIILSIEEKDLEKVHKLPDHHNMFGTAWWIDGNISYENTRCVFSADKDA